MRYFIPLLSASSFVVLGAAGAAHADMGDQLFKLLAEDGGEDDVFGNSVAVSGRLAIVGARGDEPFGSASGSAYIFDTTTGKQVFKLLADDGAPVDYFGVAVAISGNTAIIGASRVDDQGSRSGATYVFDAATGDQLFKLLADDAEAIDQFGITVGLDGTTAVIGATGIAGAAIGKAYLFDTTTGDQLFKLAPTDGASGDAFGASVAISGPTAIVGAFGDDDNGEDAGAAYLFDVGTGAQIAKLLPDDGAADDRFGSVAIGGAAGKVFAVIGAGQDDDNGEDSGSAYVFDITDPSNPVQIAKLLPEDGAADDYFGADVAVSGATAVIGALFDDDNGDGSGSAYLFDITAGKQIAKLVSDDGAAEDQFGGSVAISDAIVIVGTAGDDDSGDLAGSAYLFEAACACDDLELCDCNDNGAPDDCDIANGTSTDCNDNGAPDECEPFDDCNDNGVFDACDIADGTSIDCNGNGVPDVCDLANGTSDDCNRNGIPDECEIDCNANGVPDDCDIANGASFDCDGNGVPDDCKSLVGDLSGDGVVGTTDLLVLLSFWGSCDDCDKCYADIDCDCTVGAADLILLLGNWS